MDPIQLAVPIPPDEFRDLGLVVHGEPNPPCQMCGQVRPDALTYSAQFPQGKNTVERSFTICWDCMIEALVGGAAYACERGIADWKRRVPIEEQG